MTGSSRSAGYDAWLDAVESGDGYYLVCQNGHGWIPPQQVCPDCASTDFDSEPLPEEGTVETYTEITVLPPQFAHRDSLSVAIASFGNVRITGQLDDSKSNPVGCGTTVTISVEQMSTADEKIIVFQPAD